MAISREVVERLAEMTRIGLSETEVERLTQDMGAILGHVSRLPQVDTGEVSSGAHITGLRDVTRPDEVGPSLPVSEVLANAAESDRDFFVVPAVFGD